MDSTAVAAVDCGTNSTRMLVRSGGGKDLERLMTITRLGEGVDRTGTLSEVAMRRTLAALAAYREVMDRHRVGTEVRMTATSAARDASNREAFFEDAERIVGVRPELLDGEEEARLSFAGAVSALDPAGGPWLVADIGGGSTELAAGTTEVAAACSLRMGCVRVTERFLAHDPPTPREVAAAGEWVRAELRRAFAAEPGLRGGSLVGLAGTVSAAAALDQQLEGYDRGRLHHHRLSAGRVRDLLGELASLELERRRSRKGMEAARADVIVGGLVVLDGLMAEAGSQWCLTSEADILDGLAASISGAAG